MITQWKHFLTPQNRKYNLTVIGSGIPPRHLIHCLRICKLVSISRRSSNWLKPNTLTSTVPSAPGSCQAKCRCPKGSQPLPVSYMKTCMFRLGTVDPFLMIGLLYIIPQWIKNFNTKLVTWDVETHKHTHTHDLYTSTLQHSFVFFSCDCQHRDFFRLPGK